MTDSLQSCCGRMLAQRGTHGDRQQANQSPSQLTHCHMIHLRPSTLPVPHPKLTQPLDQQAANAADMPVNSQATIRNT